MATATRGASPLSKLLDPEGTSGPYELTLTGLTYVFAALSMYGATVDAWALALWAGLVGCLTGATAQLISTSTHSRWLIMPAWIVAGVGFLVGVLKGGL